MTLGNGTIQAVSTTQKTNTRSWTEAEFVSIDDVISKVMWTRKFMESQGYEYQREYHLLLCPHHFANHVINQTEIQRHTCSSDRSGT
jgi:hypothetical protein